MPRKQSKQSSSSSDSEDDERMRQLKEATVSFDQITSSKAASSDVSVNKKSKRFIENEPQDDDDDDNSFNMTPEFQEFVAKKLRSKLDE